MVLAKYDIRGIQNFIYRTARLRDAVGASWIVEHCIDGALADACQQEGLTLNAKWFDENGVIKYSSNSDGSADARVLYVGGGNAYVSFADREMAIRVNKRMAKYIMDHTYSLQLAAAVVKQTDNYAKDFQELNKEMIRVKDAMIASKPIGAFPLDVVERKTGYPVAGFNEKDKTLSRESILKSRAEEEARRHVKQYEKLLDEYVDEKGKDSMLAVVHIDGNNMGLRIRSLIQGITDYDDAINQMREISYAINNSYKKVFDEMQNHFQPESDKDLSLMKVLVAGDDVTFVCRAKIALAAVEYFSRAISEYTITGKDDPTGNMHFSVCAGVAYFNSHYPFDVAYEVAEACCSSAKDRAKKPENMDGGLIGNWVDFQICRNIQVLDLDKVREREYVTASGENLLRRPYFIKVKALANKFKNLSVDKLVSFDDFKYVMKTYVQNEKNIPRSFLKDLRNAYSMGKEQVAMLRAFMESRKHDLPKNMYDSDDNGIETAVLYDALELADYYEDLDGNGKEDNAQ